MENTKVLYLPEEGILQGGFAMTLTSEIRQKELLKNTKIKINAIDNKFIPHGSPDDLYKLCRFDSESMTEDISTELK